MDIWDYFQHREREIRQFSAAPDRPLFEVAPDGSTGRMFGNLGLTDDAYLRVFERVVVRDRAFVVEKYAYFLIVDEAEVWGFEKDPTHEPAVHGHAGPEHERVTAEETSLTEALERAWEEIERRYEMGP